MGLTKIDDRGLKTPVDLLDNEKVQFGTGNDLFIYHNGTNSYIENDTGNLIIDNGSGVDMYINSGNDIYIRPQAAENGIKVIGDGGVELYYDNAKKFETKSYGANMPDDSQLYFGSDDDAVIKHTGSHFYMTNATGNWYLQPKGNETAIEIIPDGKVGLRYDNSEKLYTESSGIAINGDLSIESDGYIRVRTTGDNTSTACQLAPDGDAVFQGKVTVGTNSSEYANNYIRFKSGGDAYIDHNTTGQDIIFRVSNSSSLDTTALKIYNDGTVNIGQGLDNVPLRFGAGSDLKLFHDGSHSYIHNSTGEMKIRAATFKVVNEANSEIQIKAVEDGAVELYYDNSKKLETTSGGVSVTGNVASSNDIEIANDTGKIKLGASSDLSIYHDGSNSRIKNSTGALILNADSFNIKSTDNSENILVTAVNGVCELYYDNSMKLSTTSNGVSVTGRVESSVGSAESALFNRDGSAGTLVNLKFQGTQCGKIDVDTNSTTYTTSSDYRLKENQVYISDGITRLKTLKPYRFNWKGISDKTVDGFFAHEVTPVVPEAVTGEKDGTEMQGIDLSKLVPLLTAALQEAVSKIEVLETKVAALKAV